MSEEELAKDLGLLAALTIGVGTMIGAGIFVLPGTAVAAAGPIVVASFVIGGIIASFTALSASELGTAMPKAGGSYYYVNKALGPLAGSIAGMGNWMGLAFASAFYVLGFGAYLGVLLPLPSLAWGPLALGADQVGGLLAGVLLIGVNYVGAKETGGLQTVIVLVLMAILGVFTVAGGLEADLSRVGEIAPQGYGSLLPATALIFVSYLGFVKITSVAEEIKDPGRNLPRAVLGSVAIVTVVYVIVMIVLLGILPETQLAGSETAVVDAARAVLGSPGAIALTFAGLLATASSANASILASSRINFAMGRDRLVSDWLNKIHPRHFTPHRSILVTGGLIVLFLIVGDIKTLAKAGSVLHLIVYGLVNLAVPVMRNGSAEYDPDFEVPLYPAVPILGAITSFGLVGFMAPEEMLLALGFVVAGAIWYLVYARSRVTDEGVLAGIVSEPTQPSIPDESQRPRYVVALSNPDTERGLLTLAAALAKAEDGSVEAVHVVQVPDQTSLERAAEQIDTIDEAATSLVEQARKDAETLGVPVDVHNILSHRALAEVYDHARQQEAEGLILGYGAGMSGLTSRAESLLGELTRSPPFDVFVMKDRGLDLDRILVPTAGGPNSTLAGVVARAFLESADAEVTLLHVVPDADGLSEGRAFLEAWAEERDLEEARLRVEADPDRGVAIESAARNHDLVVLGATEEGILSRIGRPGLVSQVIEKVDATVIMAEGARERGMLERLL